MNPQKNNSVSLINGNTSTFRVCRICLLFLLALFSGATHAAPALKPLKMLTWGNVDSGLSDVATPFARWEKTATANSIKALTASQPTGYKTIHDWNNYTLLFDIRDQLTGTDGVKFRSPWITNGLVAALAKYQTFFQAYKLANGELDYFIIDNELSLFSDLYDANGMPIAARWDVVQAQTGWATIQSDLGIVNWQDIFKTEQKKQSLYAYDHYLMGEYTKQLFAKVTAKYPAAKMACYDFYGDKNLVPWAWGLRLDPGIGKAWRYNTPIGTRQSPFLYGEYTYLANTPLEGKSFGSSQFKAFLFNIQLMRTAGLSSTLPLLPWIAYKSYRNTYASSVPYATIGNTKYFEESLFHLGLQNVDSILYWKNNMLPIADDTTNAQCIRQLNELIGFSDRAVATPAAPMSDWYPAYVLSSIYANEHYVSRFTPNLPDGGTTSGMLQSSYPASFIVNGKTITFRNGTIHTPSTELSDKGWWITSPTPLEIETETPPVVYASWKLDDTTSALWSGDTIRDNSGNGHDALAYGFPTTQTTPSVIPEKNVLLFKSASYNDVSLGAVPLGNTYTLAGWVKISAEATGRQMIISNETTSENGLSLSVNTWGTSDKKLILSINNGAGLSSADNTFTYETWHHVAVVGSVSKGYIALYLDGNQVDYKSTGIPVYSTNSTARIGSLRQTSSFLSGAIAEFKVYQSAISIGQVKDVMLGSRYLSRYWKLNGANNGADGNSMTEYAHNGGVGMLARGAYDTGSPIPGQYGIAMSSLNFSRVDGNSLNLGNQFTLSCWAKIVAGGANNTQTIIKNDSAGNGGLFLYVNSYNTNNVADNKLCLSVANYSTTLASAANAFSYEGWHHMAVSADRSAGTIALYLDGQLVDSRTGISTSYINSAELNLACYNKVGYYMNGALSEFKVFSTNLNAAQICRLWNLGLYSSYYSPMGYK